MGFTIFGVCLNAIGVLLLFFFGMPFRIRKEGPAILWRRSNVEESRGDRVYTVLGYIGLAAILLGLVLQIAGAAIVGRPSAYVPPPTKAHVAHVVVDYLPPDRAATTALTIAQYALGVACVTFIAVLAQIILAGIELDTVKRDFRLAQEQFKEFSRRPRVAVTLDITEEGNPAHSVSVHFRLYNSGDRLSRDIRIEILVEAEHFRSVVPRDITLLGNPFSGDRVDVGLTPYYVLGRSLQDALYPNDVVSVTRFPSFAFRDGVEGSVVLFRAYDENFGYPASGYGEITYTRGCGRIEKRCAS